MEGDQALRLSQDVLDSMSTDKPPYSPQDMEYLKTAALLKIAGELTRANEIAQNRYVNDFGEDV